MERNDKEKQLEIGESVIKNSEETTSELNLMTDSAYQRDGANTYHNPSQKQYSNAHNHSENNNNKDNTITPKQNNGDKSKTHNSVGNRLKISLAKGFKSGSKTALWMIRMMLPITFGVSILKWLGAIEFLAEWLTPVLKFTGLTAEGILVFITSSLTNLYASIAMIATLNIDFRTATILAVMGLICHNLIVETIIQRKAGANPVYMVILRYTAAIIAAVVMNRIIPADYTGTIIIERQTAATAELGSIMYEWLMSMLKLVPIMFILIIILNSLQQILREFKLVDYLTIPLKPLMNIVGLSKESSFLWVIMNTIGLAYGGAILISEYEAGDIDPREARLLNTHVAISHSLLEDSLLFIAIGISAFWVFVPRITLSIVVVWGERFFNKITTKHSHGHQKLRKSEL